MDSVKESGGEVRVFSAQHVSGFLAFFFSFCFSFCLFLVGSLMLCSLVLLVIISFFLHR